MRRQESRGAMIMMMKRRMGTWKWVRRKPTVKKE